MKSIDVQMRTIQLIGRISGDDGYKAKFAAKAEEMRGQGFEVWNPAELPDGMTYDWYMEQCLTNLCRVDAIYCLDDWTCSPGAKTEYLRAKELGLAILPVERPMYICDPLLASTCDKTRCYLRVWNESRICAFTPIQGQALRTYEGEPILATTQLAEEYISFRRA